MIECAFEISYVYDFFCRASFLQIFKFLNLLFSRVEWVDPCENYVHSQDTEHQLQENNFHHYLHYSFL